MIYLYMKTAGAAPLFFCKKPNIHQIGMEPLYFPPLLNQTHPKSTTTFGLSSKGNKLYLANLASELNLV
jgi:hypothetical protein